MLNRAPMIEVTKANAFMKARYSLFGVERNVSIRKKTKKSENVFFKDLVYRFRLTLKLIRRVKEQQSCLCPTFYQTHFMKSKSMLVKVD